MYLIVAHETFYMTSNWIRKEKWISIATDWRLTDWADKLFPCTLEFTWTANVYCVDIKQCRLLSSVLLRSIARSSNQVMAESMYRVRKQDNCPSVGNDGTSSRIPREQAWLVSIYAVSIKHGLRTANCEPRTTDRVYNTDLKINRCLSITDWI